MPKIIPAGPYPPPAPGHDYSTGHPAPKKRHSPAVAAAAAAALLAIGIATGLGIGTAGKPATAPEVRTETKEVKVYRTPPSCITALDLNEAAFSYSSDAMQSIVRGDLAGASATTAKIRAITPQAQQAKADCRAANQ